MVPMPAAVVLIACKTILLAEPDPNEGFTGHQNREWAYEHSKMVCRRYEVQMSDIDELKGAKAQAFNQQRCQRAAIMLIPQWDSQHRSSSYRAWRVACPTPIKNTGKDGIKGTADDEIISWQMPECGHRGTIVCEMDTAI